MNDLYQNADASFDCEGWEYQVTLDAGHKLAAAVANAARGDLKVLNHYDVESGDWRNFEPNIAQAAIGEAIGELIGTTKLWVFGDGLSSLFDLHQLLQRGDVPAFEAPEAAFLKPLITSLMEGV